MSKKQKTVESDQRVLNRRYNELMDAEIAKAEATKDVIGVETLEQAVAAQLLTEGLDGVVMAGFVKSKRHTYVSSHGLQTIQENGQLRLFRDPDALLALGESEVARLGDAVEHRNLAVLNRAQGIYLEELKKVQVVTVKLDGLRSIIADLIAERPITWDRVADEDEDEGEQSDEELTP